MPFKKREVFVGTIHDFENLTLIDYVQKVAKDTLNLTVIK